MVPLVWTKSHPHSPIGRAGLDPRQALLPNSFQSRAWKLAPAIADEYSPV